MNSDRRRRMYHMSRLLIGGSRDWTHRQHGNDEYSEPSEVATTMETTTAGHSPESINEEEEAGPIRPSCEHRENERTVHVESPQWAHQQTSIDSLAHQRLSQSEPRKLEALPSVPPGVILQVGWCRPGSFRALVAEIRNS